MHYFKYEIKARLKSISNRFTALILLCFPIIAGIVSYNARPLSLLPIVIISAGFYAWFVPYSYQMLYGRKKYQLSSYIYEMTVQDREELNRDLEEKNYFSLGEMCFCSKFIYCSSSAYIIPYSQIIEFHWIKKDIELRGMRRTGMGIRLYVENDAMIYSISLPQSIIHREIGLKERAAELLMQKNSTIHIAGMER